MPIESKTWVTGEVITAQDLNKITPLMVVISPKEDAGFITNATYRDIKNASDTGKPILGVYKEVHEGAIFTGYWTFLSYIEGTNQYNVHFQDSELSAITFAGVSLDDTLETSEVG